MWRERRVLAALLGTALLGCSGNNDLSQAGDRSASSGSAASVPSTFEPFGQEQQGIATYYAATGEGACMFDASPQDMDVAAINAEQWGGSAWCGACVDVQGPSGSVRLRIVDLCPECKQGHLDLSRQAFEKIAPLEQGRVDISWQMVACDIGKPVSYRYKDGANAWWTAVQVLDHRLPIESMDFSKDGVSWQAMQRTDYNHFLTEDGFGEGETQVRITAEDGQSRVDTLPPVKEELVSEGSGQFD